MKKMKECQTDTETKTENESKSDRNRNHISQIVWECMQKHAQKQTWKKKAKANASACGCDNMGGKEYQNFTQTKTEHESKSGLISTTDFLNHICEHTWSHLDVTTI